MEKNKKIIKLCYLQIAFYVVFLTSLFLHEIYGYERLGGMRCFTVVSQALGNA